MAPPFWVCCANAPGAAAIAAAAAPVVNTVRLVESTMSLPCEDLGAVYSNVKRNRRGTQTPHAHACSDACLLTAVELLAGSCRDGRPPCEAQIVAWLPPVARVTYVLA